MPAGSYEDKGAGEVTALSALGLATDDELVEKVQEHLAAEHHGREYSREEILFMAM